MSSPLLVKDLIRPLLEPEEESTDACFYHKPVVKNGKIEWVLCFPGESWRGVVRFAVGKRLGVLAKDHEDCACALCKLFGNVHEVGALSVEDLEVVSPLEKRLWIMFRLTAFWEEQGSIINLTSNQ